MKNIYIISIFIFFSCKNKQDIINQNYKVVLESIKFDCRDKNCTNKKYNLNKKYTTNSTFILECDKNCFFEGNEKNKSFLYEVYNSRFLLISILPLINNESGIYNIERDTIFLYDLNNNQSYSFTAKGYMFTSVMSTNPIFSTKTIKKQKLDNQILKATINEIDVNKKEVILLMLDLKTKDTIKLNTVENNFRIVP